MARFVTLLFIFGLAYVQSQYIPINVGSTKKQPTCTYQFQVPDTKGACSATSTALEKKIDEVKQDLDRTRLQYVSQNSAVQGTLNQLQSETNMYVSKVQDLNTELQKIKQNLNSGQPSVSVNPGTSNNQNLNQLIHDTKDLLTKAVSDINGRIFNLSSEFQRNSIEESKVNSAIQTQINSQAVKLATAEQKLLNLENMIKNFKVPSAPVLPQPTGSAPSNAQLTTLQQKFQQLETELKTVDSLQQQQFRGLSDKTNKIMTQLMNQSHDIDTVALTVNQSVTQLDATEKLIQTTKQDFDKFKQSTSPQLQILSQEASALTNDLKDVQKQLQQVGKQMMSGMMANMGQNKDVSAVKKQADDLEKELQQIQSQVSVSSKYIVCVGANFFFFLDIDIDNYLCVCCQRHRFKGNYE